MQMMVVPAELKKTACYDVVTLLAGANLVSAFQSVLVVCKPGRALS